MKKIPNPIDASKYLLRAACRIALPHHPSLPHSTTHYHNLPCRFCISRSHSSSQRFVCCIPINTLKQADQFYKTGLQPTGVAFVMSLQIQSYFDHNWKSCIIMYRQPILQLLREKSSSWLV